MLPLAASHELVSRRPDRRVSPAQIILLKFLDAFLARPPGPDVLPPSTFEFLAALLRRTTSSLVRDQDKDSSDALMFQAAVLLLHCLASLGLASGTYLELLSGSVEDIVCTLQGILQGRRITKHVPHIAQLCSASATLCPNDVQQEPPHSNRCSQNMSRSSNGLVFDYSASRASNSDLVKTPFEKQAGSVSC